MNATAVESRTQDAEEGNASWRDGHLTAQEMGGRSQATQNQRAMSTDTQA